MAITELKVSKEQEDALDAALVGYLDLSELPSREEIAVMYEKLTGRPYEPVRYREDGEPLPGWMVWLIFAAALVIGITLTAVL